MRDVRIGIRRLDEGRPYLIAEAGVNHNGDLAIAQDMVDLAADAGVDAIKFQMFEAADLVRPDAPSAPYQGTATSQYEMLLRLELDRAGFAQLAQRTRDRGVEFLCTPFSIAALRFIVDDLGVAAVKISSGDLTYSGLLRAAAATGLPVLLSTGMATRDELRRALVDLDGTDVVLMQCVSQYPAPEAETNLRALAELRALAGDPVGFSDHSRSIGPSIAAVALGARVIERHFTLDHDLPGPDHRTSMSPTELNSWVIDVSAAHSSLGDGVKRPQPSEGEVRLVARRSLVAVRDLPIGTLVTGSDLVALRPADGISPQDVDSVTGSTIRRTVARGRPLRWDDLDLRQP